MSVSNSEESQAGSKAPTTAEDPSYMPELPRRSRNAPVRVAFSAEEINKGRFNDASIKLFLSGMHRDGAVILEGLVNPAHLDKINEFMSKDAEEELRKGEGLHRNFGTENIQQGPPLFPSEFFFDDVYLNPLLFHAATLYLGPNATWNMVTGNNALPHGTKRQPVHSDAMCNHPPAPFYAIGNIYTVDTSTENASTEIWLGTHVFNSEAQTPPRPKGDTNILDEYVEARKSTQPGIQPVVKKGSVLFRDMRTWHAGMPNNSDKPRYMIALGFSASWWHGTSRFRVPAGTGLFERIMHGTKDYGIIPGMNNVPKDEYDEMRNAHDFNDSEKLSWDAELF